MTWSVLSPDGTLTLEAGLDADGRLGYRVLRNGNEVVARSRLGVLRTDTSFDAGLVLVTATDEVVLRDRYTLVHGKQLEHDVAAGARTLELVNRDGARLDLDLRAYDEGVAFRYRFPDDGSGRARTVTQRADRGHAGRPGPDVGPTHPGAHDLRARLREPLRGRGADRVGVERPGVGPAGGVRVRRHLAAGERVGPGHLLRLAPRLPARRADVHLRAPARGRGRTAPAPPRPRAPCRGPCRGVSSWSRRTPAAWPHPTS